MTFEDAYKWPRFGEEEKQAVLRVVNSGQLFAKTEVREFEKEFAKFIGGFDSVAVCNATAGLHLSLAALNIGLGDEVIVTPYSWISTASSILMQNAVPIFCDIETDSFGIDPKEILKAISQRTKAIVLTHVFGYPSKIDEIIRIARDHNLFVIEDASHAHGSFFKGMHLGTLGDIGVFSLHQRKNLSVGDGGIICARNVEIDEKIRRLRSFGHSELSYNYRMSEFAAAIGRVRLKKLQQENEIRSLRAKNIYEQLIENSYLNVRLMNEADVHGYHAVLIELNSSIDSKILDKKLAMLQKGGLPIRKTWEPLHKHPHFNPLHIPARGLPWRDGAYLGSMKNQRYSDLILPVVENYCPNKLLELYVHPTIPEEVFTNLSKKMRLLSEN